MNRLPFYTEIKAIENPWAADWVLTIFSAAQAVSAMITALFMKNKELRKRWLWAASLVLTITSLPLGLGLISKSKICSKRH